MNKIVALYSHRNAVEIYRTFRPLSIIDNEVVFLDKITDKKEKVGDIAEKMYEKGNVWFVKYPPNNELVDLLISCRRILKERGKFVKIVVDLDDNVFQIPWGNIASLFWRRERIIKMDILVRNADWVITSTQPLADYISKYLNKNVIVLKNCLDLKQWKERPKKDNKVVKIGWVYSKTHIPDISEVKEAIIEIKKEFKDKVSIELFGGDRSVFGIDCVIHKPVRFEKYHKKLQSLNWDISIAPLLDNDFNKAKSNIKWLESSMSSACFVGSNVAPYSDSIKQGKTGFVCSNKDEWIDTLRSLIKNKKKREQIVKNAKKEIVDNYDIKKYIKEYNNFFKCI